MRKRRMAWWASLSPFRRTRETRRWSISFEDLYNNNYLNTGNAAKTTNIPKLIHQVWLGSTYPETYKDLLTSWRTLHPDWTIKVWTDTDADCFPMINRDVFNTVKNLGIKSDIFRYEILYAHGGIYIDTDFLCLKPFDDLLYLDFFGGHAGSDEIEILNGIMGCTPKHEVLKNVIDGLKHKPLVDESNFGSVLHYCGAYYLAKVFFETQNKGRCVVFPKNFFYPFPGDARFEIRANPDWKHIVLGYRKPETLCIHLWHTSWQQ